MSWAPALAFVPKRHSQAKVRVGAAAVRYAFAMSIIISLRMHLDFSALFVVVVQGVSLVYLLVFVLGVVVGEWRDVSFPEFPLTRMQAGW